MPIENFKLAVLSLDEFHDSEIEQLFLNLEVGSEEDIHEAIGILRVHRPRLLEQITLKYCHAHTSKSIC